MLLLYQNPGWFQAVLGQYNRYFELMVSAMSEKPLPTTSWVAAPGSISLSRQTGFIILLILLVHYIIDNDVLLIVEAVFAEQYKPICRDKDSEL